MAITPLVTDVFDFEAWAARTVDKSVALRGHFGPDLSIVPWVAMKAAALIGHDVPVGQTIWAEHKGALVPGARIAILDGAIVGQSGQDLLNTKIRSKDASSQIPLLPLPETRAFDSLPSEDPLLIPQSWAFHFADFWAILSDGSVEGYFRTPKNFPWDDWSGHVDPMILEEIAAQIVTLAFARHLTDVRARTEVGGELSQKYPILTFDESLLHFHSATMPDIESAPLLILRWRVGDLGNKRVAEVDYTLSVQYTEAGTVAPMISGHISATKTVIRSLRMAVAKIQGSTAAGMLLSAAE